MASNFDFLKIQFPKYSSLKFLPMLLMPRVWRILLPVPVASMLDLP